MFSITPVILSGGSGTRLWPSSRVARPKQFLRLTSQLSLLQQTVKRIQGLRGVDLPVVIANHEHRFLVAEHLREIDASAKSIILEPCSRNTAPAITLAALHALADKDTILLVLPADHIINDVEGFHRAIDSAIACCEKGKLVTFGIAPEHPATGFGYIRNGAEIADGVFECSEFIEKPDESTAQALIANGDVSWNSGIFMFRASDYLSELSRLEPAMVEQCKLALSNGKQDLGFLKVGEVEFSACESNSIDYAVMENTPNGVVIPLDVGWSDIGSWSALHELLKKDSDGNVVVGETVLHDVKDSMIVSERKLVAMLGLEGIVLVETDDAILLADINRVQEVGKLVNSIRKQGRPEFNFHRKVYRPWGSYDSLEQAEDFQVKRLIVKPGEKLSLQLHHHRAEHWVVVKGTAEVVNGEDEFILNVNQSTYIPIGVKHSLANPGDIDLEIIEVQSGSYLGEDDIVRFDDVYGRHKEG